MKVKIYNNQKYYTNILQQFKISQYIYLKMFNILSERWETKNVIWTKKEATQKQKEKKCFVFTLGKKRESKSIKPTNKPSPSRSPPPEGVFFPRLLLSLAFINDNVFALFFAI